MTEVNVNKSIRVSANQAWEALSSFRGIENYSPIERSVTEGKGAGAKRTCFMPDGAAIHEVLNFTDDSAREMQYIITEGPFPISEYISNIKVNPLDSENCLITWSCSFESTEEVEGEMKNLFKGFYEAIIENLEGYLKN